MDNRTDFDKAMTNTPGSSPEPELLGLSPEEGVPPERQPEAKVPSQEPGRRIYKTIQPAAKVISSRPEIILAVIGLLAGLAGLAMYRRRA